MEHYCPICFEGKGPVRGPNGVLVVPAHNHNGEDCPGAGMVPTSESHGWLDSIVKNFHGVALPGRDLCRYCAMWQRVDKDGNIVMPHQTRGNCDCPGMANPIGTVVPPFTRPVVRLPA